MYPDVVLVRDGDAYRLLHGQLHLAMQLDLRDEVLVEVRGEGRVKVVRMGDGYSACRDGLQLPILRG